MSHKFKNLIITLLAIFAGFAIAVAWSDAATPKTEVASCDSAVSLGAIIPGNGIDPKGTTIHKQPKKCSQYRAMQLSIEK